MLDCLSDEGSHGRLERLARPSDARVGRHGPRRRGAGPAAGARVAAGTRGSNRLLKPIGIAGAVRFRQRRRSLRRTSTAKSAAPSSNCSSSRAPSSKGRGRITRRAINCGRIVRLLPRSSSRSTSSKLPKNVRQMKRRCAVWNRETRMFEPTPWPAELAPLRARFTQESRAIFSFQIPSPTREDGADRGRGAQRLLLPPTPGGRRAVDRRPGHAGDAHRLANVFLLRRPSSSFSASRSSGSTSRRWVEDLFRLSSAATSSTPNGHSDFLVAVVARDDASRVLYESEPGAARTADSAPDVGIALLGPRLGPLWFATRDGKRTTGFDLHRDLERIPPPPPPPPGPAEEKRVVLERRTIGSAGEGHWRLIAKHRSGSLEAAVAKARTRNFLLSSGILLLLTTAIGLIVVSARRADRLARQQLEFVAAVSHELRTPVSVIGTAAGNLADGVVEEPGRVKKYGATIQAEARRLGETVERVLQLAGIAAGRASAARYNDTGCRPGSRCRRRKSPRNRPGRRHRRSRRSRRSSCACQPIRQVCSVSSVMQRHFGQRFRI